MKVKPFYIRITDDMTAQDAQDIFDKCIDAGISAGDSIKNAKSRHKQYRGNFYTHKNYGCLGLSGSDYSTYIEASEYYFKDAEEITLDQLDEWLGLDKTETPEKKEAFDSMAELRPTSDDCPYGQIRQLGDQLHNILCGLQDEPIADELSNVVSKLWSVREPETPQQREERERREEAAEMIQCLLDNYSECEESAINYVLEFLYECDYRKAK